jgi:uncharacterized protein (TIGR02588 family)
MVRDERTRGSHEPEERRRNPLETVVLVASGLLVAGAIAVLAFQGARDERPATLETRVDSTVLRGRAHHVHVTVTNEGDRAAAGALVRGSLREGSALVAESEATIDWVPGRSSAGATLLFDVDPSRHELDVRVTGFADP